MTLEEATTISELISQSVSNRRQPFIDAMEETLNNLFPMFVWKWNMDNKEFTVVASEVKQNKGWFDWRKSCSTG